MKWVGEAVLLKKIDYSESSLILSFCTKEHGLKKFLFKGAKKRKHAFVPFGTYEITYIDKGTDALSILTQLQWRLGKHPYYDNPKTSLVAFFCANFLHSALIESEFDLPFYDSIARLSMKVFGDSTRIDLVPLEMIGKTILYLGYCPDISGEYKPYLNLSSGEMSQFHSQACVQLNIKEFEMLTFLLTKETHTIEKKLHIESETLKSTFKILVDYAMIHIPKLDIRKSLEIIQDILYD